ncbi:sigma-70 family RNA polymerase sigma factor [Roseiconus nitratireducens]|uniref:Sigma-70 family RNA polymerase sigma factor n=1 Tax=Roseiconus nitratireducens TaxID=2605748 RepID=A0A5M6DEW7_9BACT|nr:sigma-70 family RNA polymerase sigma factor [Roseiconus nitratireducens]KAA5545933.1 sigma-70 family RNA polymerase sigma factor [Roseiconus nitratireducens]
MTSVTELLNRSQDGTEAETDRLFSVMYDDLHRLASRFLQNEPLRHRLSSSSLVHQAYMRMVDHSRINWQGKTHFFAIGATVMRRILVDHARKVQSLKRGGGWERKQLHDDVTFELNRDEDIVALDELLQRLAVLNPRQSKIVELRFFGGMTMREIAAEMKLGLRTVEKEWAMSRAWMRRELRRDSDGPSAEDDTGEADSPPAQEKR